MVSTLLFGPIMRAVLAGGILVGCSSGTELAGVQNADGTATNQQVSER